MTEQGEDAIEAAREAGCLAERVRWQAAVDTKVAEAEAALGAVSDTDHGKLAAWWGRKHGALAVMQEVLPSVELEERVRAASNHANGQVSASRRVVSMQ